MMSGRLACVLLLILTVFTFSGCQWLESTKAWFGGKKTQKSKQPAAMATKQGKPRAVPIITHHTGDDRGLRAPGITLINSQEELIALGAKETRSIPVDFATQSLILLVIGEQSTGGFWAKINGVQQGGSTIYVQATVNRPGSMGVVTQQVTYPYAAAVIRKAKGTLLPEVESVEGQAGP